MSATINDLASFNKFFTENQHRFIRFAWTYTRDEVVAEDIVMESLMAYWENRDHLDRHQSRTGKVRRTPTEEIQTPGE